jgi:hypothetical protein
LLTDGLVGSQTPRVHSFPEYVTSAGQEAVELAESAGLYLDPWQQLVLRDSLGERRDGRWSAFEVGLIVPRQNGKGSVLEARELFGLFLGGDRMIVHTSHLFSTSLEGFRRIRELIESTPDLDRKVNQYRQTTGQEGIELKSGARLRFMARSKGSGRGFTGDLVIWDEAYELVDEHVDALMPTLSARPNPQIWYTSSPVLDSDTGAPLTSMRKRGIAGGSSLAYFEWSAEPGTDLDDRAAWTQSNPALGIRITEEFVARERDAMTDEGFARERLCIWPPDGSAQWQVITKTQWTAAATSDEVDHDPVALALDVHPDRHQSCLAVAGGRPDGDVGMAIVEHATGTDWVVSRTVAEVRNLKPCRLVINAAGAAASVIPDITKALAEAKLEVEIVAPNARDESAAYGMVYDALTRPDAEDREGVDGIPWRLWHRDDKRLTDAAAAASTRAVGSEGTTWAWNDSACPLKAATHAVWGYVTRPPEMDIQPLVAWR